MHEGRGSSAPACVLAFLCVCERVCEWEGGGGVRGEEGRREGGRERGRE